MSTLYKKIEKLFTLRFSILTIFISFFVISILIVASISYSRSAQNLSYLAEKIMDEISNTIYREVVELGLRPTEDEVKLTSNLIEKGLIDVNNKVFFPVYMLNIIKLMPLVQGSYWATAKNGDYWNCEDELDFSYIRIIDRTKNPPSHTITYLDQTFGFLRSEDSADFTYDPRNRPWYQGAIHTNGVFWSDIYLYTFKHLLGVAISKAVYKDGKLLGVYALKLRLDFIENYVKQQKVSTNGIAFMLTLGGKLIAISNPNVPTEQLMDVHQIPAPWIGEAYDIYSKTKKKNFTFTMDGSDYLAAFRHVPEQNDWLIGVVAPETDFIGELRRTNLITLLISLLVLFIGLYLVSQFVTRIVNPLRLLVQETERIKNFDLEGDWQANSRIKEIHAISDSIHAMKQGLRAFKKYVPSTLVRQLINTGQDAHIGGEKRKLAIFFSDIKDFTSIAENLDPNNLVNQICEYLELLSHIIIENGGTIDKYIGDSIMAFWGAPAIVEDPTHMAAKTVLQCQKVLEKIHQTWVERNEPIFTTRFGLHWGEAVVGNIGSSERLNYTALGDVINMASRLEALNRFYGTKILTSHSVYESIEDEFVLRRIDYVAVKGKEEFEFIYELLGEKSDDFAFDVKKYSQEFNLAFEAYSQKQWDKAMDHFELCLQIYPEDTVAKVFLERCALFKTTPPREVDWKGGWHYDIK